MKVLLKVLKVLGLLVVVAAAVLLAVYLYADNKPDIRRGYQAQIEKGGALEARYLEAGPYETHRFTARADAPMGRYTVYYPAEMEFSESTYPMIVVLNGTGGKATKYEPQFELFASWGFIVVGNQDKATGTGESAIETLRFMLAQNDDPESVFYQRVDVDNIGITGFSQGGAGVFNVLTRYDEARCFRAAAPLSPVSEYMTALATDYTYDSSLVEIPIMILAGTEGEFELETIIPLEELLKQYDKIGAPKVMARRVGADHDHMMYSAGGYVIAWFRWQLMGDEEAAMVFVGDEPELLSNPMYQDQRIDLEWEDADGHR